MGRTCEHGTLHEAPASLKGGAASSAVIVLHLNRGSRVANNDQGLVHTYLPPVIGAAVGGLFVVLGVFLQSNGTIPGFLPLPTTTATVTTTTTATATVTASPSSSAPAVSGSQTYWLSELDAIETEKEGRSAGCTGGCTGFRADAARIGSDVYTRSWLLGVDLDGARSSITFNPSKACSELRGFVGLSDDSPRTAITVAVEKDGATPEVLATAQLGEAREVGVDLSDVATFTLSAYISGTKVDSATAVLGDMAMTCEPGSQGSP